MPRADRRATRELARPRNDTRQRGISGRSTVNKLQPEDASKR